MDEDIGDAAFIDSGVGNGWATQHPDPAANQVSPALAEIAG
jgi:hypothetical protein